MTVRGLLLGAALSICLGCSSGQEAESPTHPPGSAGTSPTTKRPSTGMQLVGPVPRKPPRVVLIYGDSPRPVRLYRSTWTIGGKSRTFLATAIPWSNLGSGTPDAGEHLLRFEAPTRPTAVTVQTFRRIKSDSGTPVGPSELALSCGFEQDFGCLRTASGPDWNGWIVDLGANERFVSIYAEWPDPDNRSINSASWVIDR